MVGSHKSFTYMEATNFILNIFSKFWRRQTLSIDEQYMSGVRFFEIQVSWHKEKWQLTNNLVKFDKYYKSLISICEEFQNRYPKSIIKIYLKDNIKGDHNKEIKKIFTKEANIVFLIYDNLIYEIGTCKPYQILFTNKKIILPKRKYYSHLFNWNPKKSFWYNIFHFKYINLLKYSKIHNLQITEEIRHDNNLHIFDFIGTNT